MDYERPTIEIVEAGLVLLQSSELRPGAGDIGSPSVRYNSKSIWDEEESDTYYNNTKEEQNYENWN